MTRKQKIQEITDLLTFLQFYFKNNVKASFNDHSFSVETVITDILNVFEKGKNTFTNINSITHNFPAIDLHNKNGTAIQVTTNADAAKVKETIATYARHKLSYKQLIVIGFVKHSKNIKVATVVGIEYLVNKIKYGSGEQLDKVYDILHEHIPLNILHPTSDKLAFEVAFRVIDRSALRDPTAKEGSFERMVDGLREIKEIINTGKVSSKSIRAKALVEYTPKVQAALSDIDFEVSRIIQICNGAKNRHSGGMIVLDDSEMKDIDDLKVKVIKMVNDVAAQVGSSSKMK